MGTGTTERSNSLHNFTMPRELRWGNRRLLRCLKVNSDGPISPLRRVAANNSDQNLRNKCALHSRTTGDGKREIRGREIDSSFESLYGSRKVCPTFPTESDISRRSSGYDDGIAAIREKVMLDLQTAADEMKYAIFKDRFEEGEVYTQPPLPTPPPPPATVPVEGELSRPWNLRPRRRADLKTEASSLFSSSKIAAAAAAAADDGGGGDKIAGGKGPTIDAPKPNFGESEMKSGLAAVIDKPTMTLRSGGGTAASGGKRERPEFSVALSKNEIEEDFYSIAGRRPPRRPKKRARNVQRQLDTLFPGLWLSEVTPDMYKVPEDEGR